MKSIQSGPRAAATSNILDVVAVLDPPLRLVKKRKEKHSREKLNTPGSVNNWINNLRNSE